MTTRPTAKWPAVRAARVSKQRYCACVVTAQRRARALRMRGLHSANETHARGPYGLIASLIPADDVFIQPSAISCRARVAFIVFTRLWHRTGRWHFNGVIGFQQLGFPFTPLVCEE